MNNYANISEERYRELLQLASDSCELIALHDFWEISESKDDEYSLIQFVRDASASLRELYSATYSDKEKKMAKALIDLFSGRVLLSFISFYLPRLLSDKDAPSIEALNAYHNEVLDGLKHSYGEELNFVQECILAMGKEPTPKFADFVPTHLLGKEEILFDNYAVLTIRLIRLLYNDIIEHSSQFHRVITSDGARAIVFGQKALEGASIAIRILESYLFNLLKVKKCHGMLLTMLLSILNSCANIHHNLAVYKSDTAKDGFGRYTQSEVDWHRVQGSVYLARLDAYKRLTEDLVDNDEVISFARKIGASSPPDAALSHLCEFALRIELGDMLLMEYYNDGVCDELLHWFTNYKLLKDTKDEFILSKMSTVADFLLELIDTDDAKYILYHSNFYECMTLEEAYRRRDFASAEKIIKNGYDRYLEISTLSIIYRYDRHAFRSYVKELKRICLERIIRNTADVGTRAGNTFADIYGEDFISELRTLALASISTIDPTDASDERNHDERLTPDWLKKKKK